MSEQIMPSIRGSKEQAFGLAQGRVLSTFGIAARSRYVQPVRPHNGQPTLEDIQAHY